MQSTCHKGQITQTLFWALQWERGFEHGCSMVSKERGGQEMRLEKWQDQR